MTPTATPDIGGPPHPKVANPNFRPGSVRRAKDREHAAKAREDGLANLECRVADTRLVNRYNLSVLEAIKVWTDPARKDSKTIHHHGYGRFAVDGEMITLRSKMR